jgi:hypothetical protein
MFFEDFPVLVSDGNILTLTDLSSCFPATRDECCILSRLLFSSAPILVNCFSCDADIYMQCFIDGTALLTHSYESPF